MKGSSLLKKYKKAKRESNSLKEKKDINKRHNYVTKLFFRIFLSTLILLLCILMDSKMLKKKDAIKEYVNNSTINFSKITIFLNSTLGNYLKLSTEEEVIDLSLYEQVIFEENQNIITNSSFNGVICLSSGVVTRIQKDRNGLYSITISDSNNINYEYKYLTSVDFSIYSFIKKDEIIGEFDISSNDSSYIVKISKGNQYYDLNKME